ncbi:hypothetical protein [Roseateles violae]|uniref:Uncharacterized protein n=1 Tax=Roseateles violae TaxID=3058042 RepID=A0ABT8DWM7_9BURK|nr:hypothetical protein [Pelomonas sp. PFR6]MDN3920744.1 hypothetical protein [Pelomonas sp. PFR6]
MAMPRPGRALLFLLLALLHLGLGWALLGRARPAAPQPMARGAELRLIAQPALRPALSSTAPARPAPGPTPVRRLDRAPPPTAPVTNEAEAPAPQAITLPPPAPPRGESLLNSEATRRALREAARAPLLSERAASAMGDGAPLRPEEKLGRQVQQAATTDCLKGEFAGAGMGLLSLPFWALAEARGKCRR